MHTSSAIRKIFEGVTSRREMHRMFNRHRGAPPMADGDAGDLFAGEWFEIAEGDYEYMLDILPPLFMRGDMFALSEYMTGSVTSVFFALSIDGRARWFHGYCDLSDRASPQRMKAAIIERETRPVPAMTREERLEHIWSSTHEDYRGYAGERWPAVMRGKRTVLVYCGGRRVETARRPLGRRSIRQAPRAAASFATAGRSLNERESVHGSDLSRLGVYVNASWRVIVRAARSRIVKQYRHDPALTQARKRFYSEILACHARHQHLVRTFRL